MRYSERLCDGAECGVQVYLTWIPLAYIFNTNLLQILLGLFPLPPFRNLALQCLTEIGSLPEVGEEHNEMFLVLFQHFMGALVQVLPPTLDIAEVRRALLCGRARAFQVSPAGLTIRVTVHLAACHSAAWPWPTGWPRGSSARDTG